VIDLFSTKVTPRVQARNSFGAISARRRFVSGRVQAAIAALYTQAITFEEADWPQIAALYEKLLVRNPSPVIALNRAVAVAMSGRLADGLTSIEELGRTGVLDQYYLFHAARADLLRRLNQNRDAAAAYQKAAALATNPVARYFSIRDCASCRQIARCRAI
jgi:RNA polymerase sigma-70 factor (ECF subfamily)